MSAKDWLKEYEWKKSDFTDKGELDSISVSMEMFANVRILEALKRYNIDPIYCFCEVPVPANPANRIKDICVTEVCDRKLIQ